MTIAFCTTCKGRAQHLSQTLPVNLKHAEGSDAKFILLDYNSPDHLCDYLKASHAGEIESGRLSVYHFRGPGPFRMAHAKNMAHRIGIHEGADVLVNLDADNFTGEGFARRVRERFIEDPNSFLWANMEKGVLPRGINGRIAVSTSAFMGVGGYDEKYATWGRDDKDFHFRLRRAGFTPRAIEHRFLDAVLHNDRMRFKEYVHAQDAGGAAEETEVDTAATIANFGRIGCGMVYRNFDCDAIIPIGPVPTRIFGIGMHKTATTSLHHALKILGYDSAHWKSAHWARAIWTEMNQFGKSPTLEKSYAVCDLPIPLLYQALDIAYPGSKFILTVRNERRWLESVRNHWSDSNPFRRQWDDDPFTHQVHTALYGRRTFDEAVFLARYRRHNAEVLAYFRDRPEDLLVMDMDAGAGWPGLCSFFRKPVPDVPYPAMFQFSRQGIADANYSTQGA